MSTHLMLAALTKAEELALDKKEAEALALSIAEVQKYYPMSRVSAKTLAWYNLAQTAGLIYGPRIVAMRIKMSKPKAPAQPAPPRTAPNAPPPPGANGMGAMPFDPAFGVAMVGGDML